MALERLAGSMGNGGDVFRDGDSVLRPVGPHAPAVTALLTALAETTFIAPVPLPAGAAAEGMERFSWIDGDVGVPPFPAWVMTDEALAGAGRLLRDLAQMAKMWAPLRPRDRAVTGMAELDPFHRLGVLARAYGLEPADHEEFVAAMIECRRVGVEFVRRRLRAGEPAFVAAWGPKGGEAALELDLVWVIERRAQLLAALG